MNTLNSLSSYLPDMVFQPLFIVLALLAVAIILFIQNKLRMDVVALLVMLGVGITLHHWRIFISNRRSK